MEARVKYFLMNGNRRALIVIIVSFLASDCIQITYASKRRWEEAGSWNNWFVLMGKKIPMLLPSHLLSPFRPYSWM
jgi:hypothetical protein